MKTLLKMTYILALTLGTAFSAQGCVSYETSGCSGGADCNNCCTSGEAIQCWGA